MRDVVITQEHCVHGHMFSSEIAFLLQYRKSAILVPYVTCLGTIAERPPPSYQHIRECHQSHIINDYVIQGLLESLRYYYFMSRPKVKQFKGFIIAILCETI